MSVCSSVPSPNPLPMALAQSLVGGGPYAWKLAPYAWKDHHWTRSLNPCGVIPAHIFTSICPLKSLSVAQHPSPCEKSRMMGQCALSIVQLEHSPLSRGTDPPLLKSTLRQVDPSAPRVQHRRESVATACP